jgi:lantibiotic modifying enzyme
MRTFRSIAPPGVGAAPAAGATDLLGAAAGLGERLVREAVWYRGRCNWIGVDGAGARRTTAHRALGPGLGDGTAGIAVFLAELSARTGTEAVRRTALGAIGQALAHAGEASERGLYAGRPGIAYSAARCGAVLGDERLRDGAARLARARRRTPPGDPRTAPFDLHGGGAGAIVAYLALARQLGDERLVARAARLGNELVGGARRERVGWSWPRGSEHGLCGMAHGAAGAAWALLELFAATGEDRHRAAAECAIDYEEHWFDPDRGNWPDLRGIERREPHGAFTAPYATAWDHGAPGIALSRLRAWEILGDERHRAAAAIALATTAASVERRLLEPAANFSLGHGLAGNADVLLLSAGVFPEGAALARRAGETGAGRYATSLDGWPCGAGRTPALLTGDAGIGLFLLRLHEPAVASALLPEAHSPR